MIPKNSISHAYIYAKDNIQIQALVSLLSTRALSFHFLIFAKMVMMMICAVMYLQGYHPSPGLLFDLAPRK